MAYGKSRYNSYRKRSFCRSDKQRREYAETMNELEEVFDNLDDGIYLLRKIVHIKIMINIKFVCLTIPQIINIMTWKMVF